MNIPHTPAWFARDGEGTPALGENVPPVAA